MKNIYSLLIIKTMRKTILLTFALLVTAVFQNAFSKTVDVQTAQKIALTFYTYNTNTNGVTPYVIKLAYTRKESDNTIDFYVFDIYPKGFVMISADNNAEPILAFSDESFFEPNVPNSGIEDWMDDVANNMKYIIKNNVPADDEISAKWVAYSNGQNPVDSRTAASSISPMLTTTWNQSPYYNEFCPGGSITGCVATAMAQIMKFWSHPTTGTGSYSYTDGSYGTLSADFGTTTYKWSSMPNALSSSTTAAQDSAVATLMYQCGVSVAMEYSPSGSGAYVLQSENPGGPCAQYSYINYFGYNSKTMLGVRKASYTSQEWNIMLVRDLNLGHPIEYEGFGVDGGHTWVLDGYNSSGLAHMNWGWGGLDNGYYNIKNLNPSGIPLGTDDGALMGIEPSKTSTLIGDDIKLTNNNQKTLDLTAPGFNVNTESFNLYPVPATNTLTVQYSGSIFSTATIFVSNMLGQTIASYPSVNLNENYQLDISKYTAGVYFISIINSTGNSKKVIKFIKD